jgi:APA family basic amino acid/polyamine antiporter
MDKKKNVSFLAVIFLVLGNCIGAGIFFKNATILNNTGSVVLSIVAWIIACFAIFCICMTLGEIVKKSGFENTTGYIG